MDNLLQPLHDRSDVRASCWEKEIVIRDVNTAVNGDKNTHGDNNHALYNGTCPGPVNGTDFEDAPSDDRQIKADKFSNNNISDFEKEWKGLCNHKTCEPQPPTVFATEDSTLNGDNHGGSDRELACPVEEQFKLLQSFLLDLGLPATVDRAMQPRRTTSNDIAIVYLTELFDGLAPILEGNRQYPGSTLLVLTTSWLSRIPSDRDHNQDWLYVHKAITFDLGGRSYVDCFMPPRRATYFVNLLTKTMTEYHRKEGEVIMRYGLDCPMASTIPLTRRADNKLLTRMMCAKIGVGHPITLGFWLPGQSEDVFKEHHPTIQVIKLEDKNVDIHWLRPLVADFLNSGALREFPRVVVKPFGSQWNTCQGVTFHSNKDVTGVINAILNLLAKVDEGDGVLVDSFHATIEPLLTSSESHRPFNLEAKLGFRIRSIVSRTPQNGALMTMVVCGVADGNEPINGVLSITSSLEMTLHQWGIYDKSQIQDIYNTIRRNSEDLMLEFMKRESTLSPEEKGCATAETDLLGIDFILAKINDVITPICIEVNAHDCLYACFIYENATMEFQGQVSRTVVQTMMARSQNYLMIGKVVVIIGAGGHSLKSFWPEFQSLGIKVVLVDSDTNHDARNHVFKFLHYDMTNHFKDFEHVDKIVKLIRSEVKHVDGCVTFCEDCAPLTALVAHNLGLKHVPSFLAALRARKTDLTMKTLIKYLTYPPNAKHSGFYATSTACIHGQEDVESAVKQVSLPAIMKLECSSSVFCAKQVHTTEEVLKYVRIVQDMVNINFKHPQHGLGETSSLILMKQLIGTEHNIDLIMFQGQLMAAFVSDYGPSYKPLCIQTICAMPSVLCHEKQSHLVTGAATCCRTLGLHTGVFSVKMIMTQLGPKLIRIKCCEANSYLNKFTHRCYGVNLHHMALMAACGVCPSTSNSIIKNCDSKKVRTDCGQLLSILLYASRHRTALATSATPERLLQLQEKGTIIFTQLQSEVKEPATDSEEPFGNLAVHASNLSEARTQLISICETLGIETKESLKDILKHFMDVL